MIEMFSDQNGGVAVQIGHCRRRAVRCQVRWSRDDDSGNGGQTAADEFAVGQRTCSNGKVKSVGDQVCAVVTEMQIDPDVMV